MSSLNRNQATESVGPHSNTDQDRGKAKDVTRLNNLGELEYFLGSTKTWVLAVYHEDIRAELIEKASKNGVYDHPRKSG